MITDKEQKGELPNTKPESSSYSRLWSGLKDPRIGRVSKAFGGKDRHSKVSTIRGLRDRRVRLSVPTAIQLYDLQDRLGLNQPSKVVDWLLNAAQHEIDKLPPLELPIENFIQFHQSLEASKAKNHCDQCLNVEGEHQIEGTGSERGNAALYQDVGIYNNEQCSSHQDHMLPYASYYHLDSSNRTYFSQLGILSSQVEVAPASVFSPYMTDTCELDGRQLSHLQIGSSAQQNLPLNSTILRNSFHS